jgi:hypothetical protein
MAAPRDPDGGAPATGSRAGEVVQASRLSRSVERALDEQRRFESHRATRLGRGLEAATGPIAGLARRVLPESALRQALRLADRGAGWTLPKGLRNHDPDDIDACEAAALRVQKWAVAGNAASGFGAGWFGGAGLGVDVPATIAMAARNVRGTGLAYGFGGDDDDELVYRLALLELAATAGFEARGAALGKVNRMAAVLSGKAALESGADWVVDKVVERVSRQLGVSFLQRKAGQIVPVIGGAVGAAVNASFQTDVSRAARYGYRQRWLMHRKVIAGPKEETP